MNTEAFKAIISLVAEGFYKPKSLSVQRSNGTSNDLQFGKGVGIETQPEIQAINRNAGSEKSFLFGNRTHITGFTQRLNNQDAYVICEENGAVIWARYYDTSPDDTRGKATITNGTNLYVAFSCTRGN